MQLDLEKGSGTVIRSFSPGQLYINDTCIDHHVIVTVDEIITDWSPVALERLSITDFALALERNPEVILFGTGIEQRFPNPRLTTKIMQEGIGFEIMDTAAACRTFNVLASEQRRVIAALMVK